MSTRRSSRRGKGGAKQMDIWIFSQQQNRFGKKPDKLPNPKKISNKTRTELNGRLTLLAFAEGKEDEISRKTHMLARVKGIKEMQYVTQRINQSGEPDGKQAEEDRENLILLPKVNDIIELKNGKSLRVCAYNLAANTVELADATTAKRKGSALEAKQSKKSKRKSKNEGAAESKKLQAKPKSIKAASATPRRQKKPMDKPTTSSNESVKESDVFTVETVLKSFANPRDDLFNRSCSYIVVEYNMDGCTLERIYDR